jgi:N utilization substance protein B
MVTERRRARKDALEILFENEIVGRPIEEILANRRIARDEVSSDFTLRIVNGVKENQEKIDEIIIAHTDNWTIDRMPVIDRSIIRIGLYEFLFEKDIPYSVTINEAVELAKAYGMEESSKFVNGILGKVAGELQQGSGENKSEDKIENRENKSVDKSDKKEANTNEG